MTSTAIAAAGRLPALSHFDFTHDNATVDAAALSLMKLVLPRL